MTTDSWDVLDDPELPPTSPPIEGTFSKFFFWELGMALFLCAQLILVFFQILSVDSWIALVAYAPLMEQIYRKKLALPTWTKAWRISYFVIISIVGIGFIISAQNYWNYYLIILGSFLLFLFLIVSPFFFRSQAGPIASFAQFTFSLGLAVILLVDVTTFLLDLQYLSRSSFFLALSIPIVLVACTWVTKAAFRPMILSYALLTLLIIGLNLFMLFFIITFSHHLLFCTLFGTYIAIANRYRPNFIYSNKLKTGLQIWLTISLIAFIGSGFFIDPLGDTYLLPKISLGSLLLYLLVQPFVETKRTDRIRFPTLCLYTLAIISCLINFYLANYELLSDLGWITSPNGLIWLDRFSVILLLLSLFLMGIQSIPNKANLRFYSAYLPRLVIALVTIGVKIANNIY